jgi:hypothetical protein
LQEKLGGTSDSIPDMNEQNDGDGKSATTKSNLIPMPSLGA